MIRKRILLASLLKPVSDTRLYEKIGLSLVKLPELEVHVAGHQAPLPTSAQTQHITFHPIFRFKRVSLGRITAQAKFWKLLKEVKPDLLVVGAHELLPLAWLYCYLQRCQLIYDVQENYFLNLTTQHVYSGFIGKLLGYTVRGMEKTLAPSINHFFLAEKSYEQELPFLGKRYTVLQNKYLPPPHIATTNRILPVCLAEVKSLRLLYSGTISRLYGIMEAIEFVAQLRTWIPEAELTIIGYCAEENFLQELRTKIQQLPYVTLLGGASPVPHEEILRQEQAHHIGLLPYQPHPSTFNCIPTKLFEYIGNGLVVIMEENPLWEAILQQTDSGITFPFTKELSRTEVELLLNRSFYQNGIPEEVFWQNEEHEIQAVVKSLLNL